jgi:hypothetical protein
MKFYGFITLATLATFTSAFAEDTAPKIPATTSVELSLQDMQIYSAAITLAAGRCGKGFESSCQIGLNEAVQQAKLADASKKLDADIQKAQADLIKFNESHKKDPKK